ncbi:MAG: helix-turn-helix domain-containing protein [Treponema sp.]|jgi:transcriptional regulator with XRE-family HTH domain|nr:helix-turn-helix domain-containing protein [Treponema sp.]
MSEKKLGIRDILALNLKENRRKLGLTQEKLSEKAGISAHYLAMIEVSRKFPTPEMLDTLAEALEIETYQLFDVSATPEGALLHLEKSIMSNIEQVVAVTIKKTLADELKSK